MRPPKQNTRSADWGISLLTHWTPCKCHTGPRGARRARQEWPRAWDRAAQAQSGSTHPASSVACRRSPSLLVFACPLSASRPHPHCPAPLAHQLHFGLACSSYPCPATPGKLTIGQAGQKQQQQEEPQECLRG